jgi:hypothetical protein
MGISKISLASFVWLILATGCGDQEEPEPRTCDDECRDQVAARSLRETMKLAYNLTLQGNLVGLQVESTDCPLGGSAELTGFATSVAEQGATEVELEYRFEDCAYLQRDDEADENYDVVIDGIVRQTGIIAVQPTANTALLIEAASLAVAGTVFDPPESYVESECAVQLAQNGNNLSGSWCGRAMGFDL